MYLKVFIFANIQRKKLVWLGNKLQKNVLESQFLANIVTWIFKNVPPVQSVVVPPVETNISKLLTANYLLPFLS